MATGIRLRSVLWLALVGLAATLLVGVTATIPAAGAITFVVDNTTDDDTLSACTTAPGDCSLRGAVDAANSTAGEDTITFAIPAAQCPGGICRVTLTEGPLELTEAATLDATTQPQNGGPQANVCATEAQPSHMRIEVVTTGTQPAGFVINHSTGSSTIRGFAIGTDSNGGNRNAISAEAGSGHHIACNHLGLDAAGNTQLGSIAFSNMVLTTSTAEAVVVGTNGDGIDDVAERNVFGPGGFAVSINTNNNNRISGNYFGFTADGASSLDTGIVFIRQWSSDNLVGVEYDGVSDDIEPNYFGPASGIYIYPASHATSGNHVIGNTFGMSPLGAAVPVVTGIEVADFDADDTGYEFRNNEFVTASGYAIYVLGTGSDLVIDGNQLSEHSSGVEGVGIRLEGSMSAQISNNDISNYGKYGVMVLGAATFAAGSTDNCIVGNVQGAHEATDLSHVFENNWWGAADGPSGAGPGSGDPVVGDIDFDPWLTRPAAICNAAPVASDASLSVAEDAAVATTVGTVDAVDDDGDTLEYSITAGDPGAVFAIDAASGVISTAAALDYEALSVYSLTVQVDDGVESDTATVDITVTNVAPVASDASFTVAEDVAAGTTVGTVSATDGAATLEYAITAGDPGGRFAINTATGEITTATALDYEATPSFSLTVEVSDGLLSDTASVAVTVTDIFEPPAMSTFGDVPESHIFYLDIEWLAASGITKGCNPPDNDMYCPDDSVTRGQMAAFLVRGLDLTTQLDDPFSDDDGSIFEDDIEKLAAAGITLGCNPPLNDMFCPGESVTRGQMAAFLVRAMGYVAGAGSDRFVDDDGSVFEADIERLAEAGVTRGCNPPTNDQFCPTEPVSRGQMAAFLRRALGTAT